VVHAALFRDPKLRYATAADMAQALAPFACQVEELALERIKAVPESARRVVRARPDTPSDGTSQDTAPTLPRTTAAVSSPPRQPTHGTRWRAGAVAGALGTIGLAAMAFMASRALQDPVVTPANPPSASTAAVAADDRRNTTPPKPPTALDGIPIQALPREPAQRAAARSVRPSVSSGTAASAATAPSAQGPPSAPSTSPSPAASRPRRNFGY
jgi:hypothetical protein